jgi:hypothetical protein
MFQVEILFRGKWTMLFEGFESRDDANWEIAQWRQHYQCTGDPFRIVATPLVDLDALGPPSAGLSAFIDATAEEESMRHSKRFP